MMMKHWGGDNDPSCSHCGRSKKTQLHSAKRNKYIARNNALAKAATSVCGSSKFGVAAVKALDGMSIMDNAETGSSSDICKAKSIREW